MQINTKQLKALSVIASQDKTRAVLNSVRIENKRMMATDGYMLLITPHDQEVGEPVQISTRTVKSIPEVRGCEMVSIEKKGSGLIIKSGNITQTDVNVGGNYPDVDMVIPCLRERDDLKVTLNLDLLNRIYQATKKLKNKTAEGNYITLHLDRSGEEREHGYIKAVRFDLLALKEATGVIMPVRL